MPLKKQHCVMQYTTTAYNPDQCVIAIKGISL